VPEPEAGADDGEGEEGPSWAASEIHV
jgi:hypothetical protein